MMPSSSLHIHACIHTSYILVFVCLFYVLRSNIDNSTQPILPPSAPFLTLHLLQWLHRRYLSKLTNAFQERDSSPPPSCLFSGCSSSSPFPCRTVFATVSHPLLFELRHTPIYNKIKALSTLFASVESIFCSSKFEVMHYLHTHALNR